MFDTNVFNQIIDNKFNADTLHNYQAEFYATHIQLDEISETKNNNRRKSLLVIFPASKVS